MQDLQPAAVVDVGCGTGIWLAAFRDAGVAHIRGVDGDWVDRSALEVAQDAFTSADLSAPFDLGERFDLAVSLEVAEHLPPTSADGFIASLTALAPVVLFSAAIPWQGGTDHLNEQWPSYWADKFAAHGYVPVDSLRARIWNTWEIAWWYRQNAGYWVDQARLADHPTLAAHGSHGFAPLVHPQLWSDVRGSTTAAD
jgi:SAM-dependent methyltransferase